MGAGTKILAGCGCLALVTAVALVAGLGLGLFWLKDKAERLAGGIESIQAATAEIDAWESKANAHPWEPPPNGVIAEPRLVAFLDVRRRVHAVYETLKGELEALRPPAEASPETADPARILALGGRTAHMFVQLRLAQVKALAEVGMSEREYRAIQLAVYKTAGALRTEAETGRTPAEAVAETSREMQEAVRAGVERAREAGVPGADRVTDDDVRELEKSVSRVGSSGAQALAVPPENVALVRKYHSEIDRYAMHGLAFLGL